MRRLYLLLLFPTVAWPQEPLLWGSLEPGPHAVGFTSSVLLDHSRKYDRNRRPILMQCWYPALDAPGPPLVYADYLRVPSVAEQPLFAARLQTFVRAVVVDDLFHKAEADLPPAERDAWDRLLSTPTLARAGPPHAPGPFPVVLYHPGAGGSFEDNSVLFEYLASHGYVVVSSAFESPFPASVGNNLGGMERSGPDFDFLARAAAAWPFADGARLAVMGHSAGAQNLLQWIGSPHCPARAAVSLDTTLEYTAEDFYGHKVVRDAMRKLTPPAIPVLLFAQANRDPRFTTFARYLRNSQHYEAAAAAVGHEDFVTHGFLGRTLRGAPEAAAIRRSYEEICRTILYFLDATLRHDPIASRRLADPSPSSPVFIRTVPPATTQFRRNR
jgi:dienelactone hydrolase